MEEQTYEPELPGSDSPIVMISHVGGPFWSYRWWDQGDAWVAGEPPTRHKTFRALGGVLAALLADAARRDLIHAEMGLQLLSREMQSRNAVPDQGSST